MATIEHVLPADLKPLDGAGEGVFRPGLRISQSATGHSSSNDWFEYNLRSYAWSLARFGSSTTKLQQWQAFLKNTRSGGDACWIKEALPGIDPEAVLSPLADASRTSWVFPFEATPTDVSIMGERVYLPADYTLHDAANILTDAQANAVGGVTTGMDDYGAVSIASVAYPVADGLTSFRVTPDAAAANLGLETTTRPACDASQIYTFFAAFRGTGDVRLDGKLYNSGGTAVGSTASDTGTMTEDGWTILTSEHVGHADAVTAYLSAYRTTSADTIFHVACLGIIPGDLTQWFLPSSAPMVLEFATAPATRTRITATGNGTRIVRCRMQAQRGSRWQRVSPGTAESAKFSAFEELE